MSLLSPPQYEPARGGVMGHFYLSDKVRNSPLLQACDDNAVAFWYSAICHCSRRNNGGFIADTDINRISGGGVVKAARAVKQLLANGLIAKCDDGHQLQDVGLHKFELDENDIESEAV